MPTKQNHKDSDATYCHQHNTHYVLEQTSGKFRIPVTHRPPGFWFQVADAKTGTVAGLMYLIGSGRSYSAEACPLELPPLPDPLP